jgi:hypothetical protein
VHLDNFGGESYVDGVEDYLFGDFHAWIKRQDRGIVLRFAKDIA